MTIADLNRDGKICRMSVAHSVRGPPMFHCDV